MKKIICYLLITLILIVSCIGCGNDKKNTDTNEQNKIETEVEEGGEFNEETIESDEKIIEESSTEELNEDSSDNESKGDSPTPESTPQENTNNYSASSTTGHNHTYKETVVNATCTTTGTKTYTCSACSYSYTETIPQISHSWVEATCTSVKKCSVCGTTEGSALGHNYSGGTCTRCGEKVSFSMEYVMAAYALRDAYNSAKFPETLYIQKAYYTTDNGAGNPVVVLWCAAQNSMGGYSLLYSRAMKDPNPDINDYCYDNSYYIDVMVSNNNPYLSYSNYIQIDVQTCYDAYTALF